jgi:hypothetical protein
LNLADASKIHGRFNYHLKNCLLLHSEEAVFGGDKKHRAIIKDYIANKSGEYEEKYMGIVHAKSYGRLIYTSNEVRAAPIELGDTRHTIFNFTIAEKWRKAVPPRELVQALYNEAIGDGPRALLNFLLQYEGYDSELMSAALRTREKEHTLSPNLDPTDEYWLEKLKTGELLDKKLRWAQGSPRSGEFADASIAWPHIVSRTALYADYLTICMDTRVTPISSYKFFQRLGEWLKRPLAFKLVSYLNECAGNMDAPRYYRELYTGPHKAVANLPPLDKCREAFDKYAGQDFEWDNLVCEDDDDEITQEMNRDARRIRY